MKLSTAAALALSTSASAHTIFQKLSVNGAQQANLYAVRAPTSDYPVLNVQSNDISCNTGVQSTSNVVEVKAGDKIGQWWQHVIGGPQGANDPDNPIASSHKGPFMVYMAKVDNAGTTATTGLKWFKVYQDTVDSSGKWGVDRMIANSGWTYFNIPQCIAPGDYLLRAELLALHSAYTQGQAQFYMSCANIRVSGTSGTASPATVSLPGAYSATDPGILISIYDASGQPTNGGKAYTAPGPAPLKC